MPPRQQTGDGQFDERFLPEKDSIERVAESRDLPRPLLDDGFV